MYILELNQNGQATELALFDTIEEEKIKRIGFLLKDTVKSSLTRSKMN